MTPRETLEKYGLKTDVKSIMERIFYADDDYFVLVKPYYKLPINAMFAVDECRAADLSLLCELAEKGESALAELKEIKKRAEEERNKNDRDVDWYGSRNPVIAIIDFIIKGKTI